MRVCHNPRPSKRLQLASGRNLCHLQVMGEPAEVISNQVFDEMVALRRELHRHPELSGEERMTSQRIASRLASLPLEVRTGVGGHGIVADLKGQVDGPMVALRADMDALPVVEETGLPFSSQVPGVMHACGHDGHTSMLFGALHLLCERPAIGPVRFLWQPSEETASGARAMITDGALEGVGMIFGGHLDRHYPPGVLAITEGPVNAATDMFRIEIRGKGGHAGRPHETLDAVVAASLLVTALQTIVSREVNPAHPSVVTVGTFTAGTAANVIAGQAVLEGTIRSQDLETRLHLHQAIERISKSIGQLHGAVVDVGIRSGTPVLVNSSEMATLARQAARDALGAQSVVELHTANMGGEDFAEFLQTVPGSYIRIGGQVAGLENQPAHSSRFDFDERAMAAGAVWFAQVARLASQRLCDEALRHDHGGLA